jgi:hypothetical protein
LQSFLTALTECSVSMPALALAYIAITPLISRRYAAKWGGIVCTAINNGIRLKQNLSLHLGIYPGIKCHVDNRKDFYASCMLKSSGLVGGGAIMPLIISVFT